MNIYKFKFQISNFKFYCLLLTAHFLLLTPAVFAEQKSITVAAPAQRGIATLSVAAAADLSFTFAGQKQLAIAAPAQRGIATLSVAAAADLSFALKEISQQFEKDTGIKVVLSFGSTGMLEKQIENGAPFDIFFAANEKYVDELESRGLVVPDTKKTYAQGRIVIAVNKTYGINAKKLEDLLDPSVKKIAIANPDHAPYGIAAKEAMLKLGLWDKLKPKMVYAENIRQAVQFVQTGDASAGIVALSVADTADITYTIIDSSLHNPINQAAAIIKATKVEKDARLFIDYVNSADGRTIMKKYGFSLPGEF